MLLLVVPSYIRPVKYHASFRPIRPHSFFVLLFFDPGLRNSPRGILLTKLESEKPTNHLQRCRAILITVSPVVSDFLHL